MGRNLDDGWRSADDLGPPFVLGAALCCFTDIDLRFIRTLARQPDLHISQHKIDIIPDFMAQDLYQQFLALIHSRRTC